MKDLDSDSGALLHAELTEKIIGVFYGVYNELGHGFLESVYQAAMVIALEEAGLSVKQQVEIPVWFRGRQVGLFFADLLVEDVVFLELKSQRAIEPANEAQTLNYLRATTIEVALLFNFGPKPEFRRKAFNNDRKVFGEQRSREGKTLVAGSDPRASALIRGNNSSGGTT